MNEEDRAILSAVTFPVFAPEGAPLEISGWSGGGESGADATRSLSLTTDLSGLDGAIDVDSELAPGEFFPADAARDVLSRMQGHVEPATAGTLRFRVDGVELQFVSAHCGPHWVAAGSAGDVTITVEATGVDPGAVHLRSLADPALLHDDEVPDYRPLRKALDVLDADRVRELATDTPIEDLGDALAGLTLPAFALLPDDDAGDRCWIGGAPSLPGHTSWPVGVHGPMMFIVQLALADLDPAVWNGPKTGHLHVFCDVEPASGSIEHAGACVILHSPDAAVLTPSEPPSDLHENGSLRRRSVTPRRGLTLPDVNAPASRPLGIGFSGGRRGADTEAFWKVGLRLGAEQGWHQPLAQLLGWPVWQNDDNMSYLAGLRGGETLDWTLLLQTDALDAELYVVLPVDDLAAGRFDRAEAIVEFD